MSGGADAEAIAEVTAKITEVRAAIAEIRATRERIERRIEEPPPDPAIIALEAKVAAAKKELAALASEPRSRPARSVQRSLRSGLTFAGILTALPGAACLIALFFHQRSTPEEAIDPILYLVLGAPFALGVLMIVHARLAKNTKELERFL